MDRDLCKVIALLLHQPQFEIKLGDDKRIEEGAKSLKEMAAKIDIDKMNTLSFLMVLTGPSD